jgi:hypothetical protein
MNWPNIGEEIFEFYKDLFSIVLFQHCTQILVSRVCLIYNLMNYQFEGHFMYFQVLLFLTSFKEFRQKLTERSQLKTLVQLLDPTLDPQLLCLLLQTVALIALNPSTHRNVIEMQVDDPLIQMLLPADDWFLFQYKHFPSFICHIEFTGTTPIIAPSLATSSSTMLPVF